MKLLLIYCNNFGYTPTIRTVDTAPEINDPADFKDVQVAFIQVEQEDVDRVSDVEKKLVKNIKWACGKNNTKKIVLHSFAHLSDSKADPEFTGSLLDRAEERMKNAGYEVSQTPFGYFLDLRLDAPGYSLARIFKNI
jgi:hypothetical protein